MDVLRLSSRYQRERKNASLPLDEAAQETVRNVYEMLGTEGFRALGVTWREVESRRDLAYVDEESDLIFTVITAFLDPSKESARRGHGVGYLGGSNNDALSIHAAGVRLWVEGVVNPNGTSGSPQEGIFYFLQESLQVTSFRRNPPIHPGRRIRPDGH